MDRRVGAFTCSHVALRTSRVACAGRGSFCGPSLLSSVGKQMKGSGTAHRPAHAAPLATIDPKRQIGPKTEGRSTPPAAGWVFVNNLMAMVN